MTVVSCLGTIHIGFLRGQQGVLLCNQEETDTLTVFVGELVGTSIGRITLYDFKKMTQLVWRAIFCQNYKWLE